MNKDVLKKYENENYMLEIIRDDDSENPRKWDNIWTLCLKEYNRCELGDITVDRYENPIQILALELGIEIQKEIEEIEDGEVYTYIDNKEDDELIEDIKNVGLLIPLDICGYYTYEVSIKRNFYDVEGYAFVSFETIKKEYGEVNDENIEKALSYLNGEIQNYNQWLSGDVYGFILYKKEKCECCKHVEYDNIDSCWGFYGDDFKENSLFENIDLSSEELDELIKGENEEVA